MTKSFRSDSSDVMPRVRGFDLSASLDRPAPVITGVDPPRQVPPVHNDSTVSSTGNRDARPEQPSDAAPSEQNLAFRGSGVPATVGPGLDTLPERESPADIRELGVPMVFAPRGYEASKRILDILGSLFGLILLSPLMALCAILVKLQDGGPVFFRQVRVGKYGREFEIVKYRSMVIDAESMQSELAELNEHDDNRTFKILNDPRVTPVGRFLRRTSLDELPQLWNVLKGDMSLVGPRPALPREVALYDVEHLVRLSVTPGLTCIWQVSGRSRLGFDRQMAMDLDYIQRRSIGLDLRLMAQTIPVVILGDGAA